jgi:hypothetical protein
MKALDRGIVLRNLLGLVNRLPTTLMDPWMRMIPTRVF